MSLPITGGIWPAVLTAFKDDGTPNLNAMDQLVELFIKQKLGGLYLLGSTGQGPAIPVEDRKIIAKRVITTANGRIPVMVHVGAVATRDAVTLAKHAADCGADAISSVPPIYFPADVMAMFDHYRQIAEATKLPFYPYHAAFLAGALPAPDEFAKRLLELPNFKGLKYTSPDMYYLLKFRRHLGPKAIVFSGADELMCHATLSGSNGAIGSFYNLFGPTFAKVNNAFRAGNWQAGRDLQDVFGHLAECVLAKMAGFGNFIRLAMRLKYNIDVGKGITPLHHREDLWTEGDVRKLIDMVDAVGAKLP
jgi:N-acetylneuraminate lyase